MDGAPLDGSSSCVVAGGERERGYSSVLGRDDRRRTTRMVTTFSETVPGASEKPDERIGHAREW